MNTPLVLFLAFFASALAQPQPGWPCGPNDPPGICGNDLECDFTTDKCVAKAAGVTTTTAASGPTTTTAGSNGATTTRTPSVGAVGESFSSQCVDLHAPGRISDCPRRKHLCENKLYYDLMTAQCPKTCGRCPSHSSNGGGAQGNSNCVDLHAPGRVSDCPRRKYLCDNDLYRDLMAVQCPFTCGKC